MGRYIIFWAVTTIENEISMDFTRPCYWPKLCWLNLLIIHQKFLEQVISQTVANERDFKKPCRVLIRPSTTIKRLFEQSASQNYHILYNCVDHPIYQQLANSVLDTSSQFLLFWWQWPSIKYKCVQEKILTPWVQSMSSAIVWVCPLYPVWKCETANLWWCLIDSHTEMIYLEEKSCLEEK